MPNDGTIVALGLGSLLEQSQVLITSARVTTTLSDQIAWLSSEQREAVLQVSMGKESFAHSQARQGPELQQLLERRRLSVQDGKDVSVMPQSWEEARERAEQLSAEVAAETAQQRRAAALAHLAEPPSPDLPPSAPSPRKRRRGETCCRSFAQKTRATGVLPTKVSKARRAKQPLKAAQLGLKKGVTCGKVRKTVLKSSRRQERMKHLFQAKRTLS